MQNIPVKRLKSGFTLIELLVVIAIIAILAAILFPVFARARENARRASCQSNEKNIALGFKQYIQDNGEKYPPAMALATDLKREGSTGSLSEYIKSSAIFYCPSDSNKVSGSYGYKLDAENESAIDNTTTRQLLTETGNRHFDGMNVAYVDGHVKWSKGVTPSNAFLSTTATGSLPAHITMFNISFVTDNGNRTISSAATLDGCSPADPCEVPRGVYFANMEVDNALSTDVPGSSTWTMGGGTMIFSGGNPRPIPATNRLSRSYQGFTNAYKPLAAGIQFTIDLTVGSETKTFYFITE